jgi:hypothetical protein
MDPIIQMIRAAEQRVREGARIPVRIRMSQKSYDSLLKSAKKYEVHRREVRDIHGLPIFIDNTVQDGQVKFDFAEDVKRTTLANIASGL